jgi:hypothetical protein
MANPRNDYLLERYRERRAKLVAMLGGQCVRCGTTERLEFDHRDPETKVFTIGRRWGTNWDTLVEETMKCQLLCSPCHHDKSRENGEHRQTTNPPLPPERWTHGIFNTYYRRGCRCEECAAYADARNAARRTSGRIPSAL